MKKVLILCYDFPPLPSIGAQRPAAFFKYFQKYNFYPVVITRKWRDNIVSNLQYFEADEGGEELIDSGFSTLIRIPEKQSLKSRLVAGYGLNRFSLIRKFLSAFELFFKWFFSFADDKHYICERASDFLKKNKIDFILVTGEPFILFKYGYKLSRKYNVPLILDYRDGWTTNHTTGDYLLTSLRLKFESLFEKKYLLQAAFFSSVSKGVSDEIISKYNISASGSFLLKNGADIDKIKQADKKNDTIFRIVYTGTLYDSSPVDEFVNGFKKFILKNNPGNIKVIFIGIRLRPCIHISMIENLKITYPDLIEIIDSMPMDKLVHHTVNASLLLLLLMKSQKKGIIGGKTYEYAATRNPILVVQEERTEETPFFQGRDIQTFAFTADEVAEKIEMYYNRFQKGESLQTSITDEEIFSISREYQVKLLAEKLNSL